MYAIPPTLQWASIMAVVSVGGFYRVNLKIEVWVELMVANDCALIAFMARKHFFPRGICVDPLAQCDYLLPKASPTAASFTILTERSRGGSTAREDLPSVPTGGVMRSAVLSVSFVCICRNRKSNSWSWRAWEIWGATGGKHRRMKVVIQRVKEASVRIASTDEVSGAIKKGLCVLWGISRDDSW